VAKPRSYRIELRPAARRALKKIKNRDDLRRIAAVIDTLQHTPRPFGAEHLQGSTPTEKLLRIRAGDYRIVYTVDDGVLLVVVVTIAHRSIVYKRLR